MARIVTCSHGHHWELATRDVSSAGELDALCPECGDGYLTPPPGESLSTDPAALFRRPTRYPPTAAAGFPFIPGYELLSVLGRGGMGVVYRARQLALDRVVAVKTLHPGAGLPDELLRRFRTEAESAAGLQHPNAVRVYEVGDAGGQPYLVMEWVNGGTLAARLARAPLSPRAAAVVVAAVARAVGAAHQLGVVHRDLKPANVLLDLAAGADPDGDLELGLRLGLVTPKVSDFGLAKRLGHHDQTHTGAALGTPSYMAPEQAAGDSRDVGPAADVWALGAILYELLTGRPPFRAANPLETLDLVRHADPIPPDRFRPRLPRDLQTVCLKCLEKSPARRYASAADLVADLDRFTAGLPVRARPVGVVGRAVRWAKRRPTAAALAGVCVVGAAAGVGGLAGHNARLRAEVERTQKQEAETARQKTAALDHVRRGHQALDDIFTSLDNPPVELHGNAAFQAHYHEQARAILRYYHDMLQTGDDADPEVRFGRGLVAVYAGRMQLRLGADPAAEGDFRRAAGLLEPLAADPAADPAVRREWAECCYWYGTLFQKTGRHPEATRSFEQTAATATALLSAGSPAPRDRRLLALCQTRLAQIEMAERRFAQAEAHAAAAAAGWERLIAADPASDIHRVWAATSLYYLAEMHWSATRWEALDDDTRRAEAVLGEYARRPPKTVAESNTVQRVGHVYRHHALGLFTRGSKTAAVDRLTAAIGLLDAVMKSSPASAFARNDAALLYRDRACFRGVVGPAADAFADWDRAIELADADNATGYRIGRAEARLRHGEWAAAVAELTAVAASESMPTFCWAESGRVLSVAVDQSRVVPDLSAAEQTRRQTELAELAIKCVRRAVAGGEFPDAAAFARYMKYPPLAALRSRPGFDELERIVAKRTK
jgi:tetratricopeptide (TPR) repeat protein